MMQTQLFYLQFRRILKCIIFSVLCERPVLNHPHRHGKTTDFELFWSILTKLNSPSKVGRLQKSLYIIFYQSPGIDPEYICIN